MQTFLISLGYDEVSSIVSRREPDPAAARVRVDIRGALAAEIGQEEQPFRSRRGLAGLVHQEIVRIAAGEPHARKERRNGCGYRPRPGVPTPG